MQYIEGLKEYTDTGKSAVTFGKFDGFTQRTPEIGGECKDISGAAGGKERSVCI